MANFNWLKQWSDNGRKMGHSVFDLSKKMCFHLPNSMILPIRFIETVPDDHFQIDISGIMRTETMNKAAFYQGKAVFSVFFVPYKQLWHNFNQFVVEKQDRHSTQYQQSAFVPNVELSKIIDFVALQYWFEVKDSFGYSAAFNSARLLQYCKIINLIPALQSGGVIAAAEDNNDNLVDFMQDVRVSYSSKFVGRYVNIWRLLAYQHIWYDFYRNKFYDDYPLYQVYDDSDKCEYIDTFNVDNISCGNIATSHITLGTDSPSADWYHDDYEYDSWSSCYFANMLDVHYCQYRKDLYTSLLPSTQFGAVSGLELNHLYQFKAGQNVLINGQTDNNNSYVDMYDTETGSVSSSDLKIRISTNH